MKSSFTPSAALLFCVTMLCGCASKPDVVSISPDIYMVTITDHAGAFASVSSMKAEAFKKANDFAAAQGNVIIPLTTHFTRTVPGFQEYELQFRVLDRNDPEATRTILVKNPDLVVTELARLGEMHKEGLLTDAEFEQAKKILLDQYN